MLSKLSGCCTGLNLRLSMSVALRCTEHFGAQLTVDERDLNAVASGRIADRRNRTSVGGTADERIAAGECVHRAERAELQVPFADVAVAAVE
jgi:hypothetical protein